MILFHYCINSMSTLSTISLSSIVSDPGAIFVNASDSVHYRQSSGASCHARTDNYLPSSVAVNNDHPRIPMWVHPFGSTSNCSVRTQAGSVTAVVAAIGRSKENRNCYLKSMFYRIMYRLIFSLQMTY